MIFFYFTRGAGTCSSSSMVAGCPSARVGSRCRSKRKRGCGGLAITTMMPVHLDSLLKSAGKEGRKTPKDSSQTAPGQEKKKYARTAGNKTHPHRTREIFDGRLTSSMCQRRRLCAGLSTPRGFGERPQLSWFGEKGNGRVTR